MRNFNKIKFTTMLLDVTVVVTMLVAFVKVVEVIANVCRWLIRQ